MQETTGTREGPDGFSAFVGAAARAVSSLVRISGEFDAAARAVVSALEAGNKVLSAGNGGSAAEAMHLAEELSGRYHANRRALPGMALCADPTALTCIGNDFGFDAVFSRQVEAFAKPGDVLALFTTSGGSANLRRAAVAAHAAGAT
ncbi:MAG: SIS domain-containing protein, partial [Kiritimatiellae bacterium]|nr:SIS domain-containing protein [Kiritimatiellia bacterium]